MSEAMKIVSLEVENVKRLKAVRVEPNGCVVTVCGKNGAGKSSLLDSIEMAFAGKRALPPRPVRDGEKSGKVRIDLGDYIVTRTFSAKGRSTIEVRNAEGASFPSPQALLDKLTGDLSFDPLAFSRQKPKEQAETLRRLTGLDFSSLDSARKRRFEDRTDVNRDVKSLRSRLQSMAPVHDDVPAEELSVADLSRQLSEAHSAARAVSEHAAAVDGLRASIEDTEKRIAALQDELKAQQKSLRELKNEAQGPVPDITSLQSKIDDADKINRLVRENAARREIEGNLRDAETRADELSRDIEKIDESKRKAIEEADMPIDGLAFGEDGVTLKGIPFEQLATSEQIRASVAIGLAMNPTLKVMLVRDGSLLDEEGKALLREMAESASAQVWMECVGTSGDVTVLIEDGEVASA